MSKTFLKIKIKSLAAEARIIRHEEKRWPGGSDVRAGLYLHRVNDVRGEARAALLAYGYLRGRAYASMERNSTSAPAWHRVVTIAGKYGPEKVSHNALTAWAAPAEGEVN